MTDLEKLQTWLMSYPAWEDGLQVDFLEPGPTHAGLFPGGLEELSRREDVLGGLQIACRYRFTLYRHTTGQADGTGNAQWLLDFQTWVQQQSAAGLTPRFGDVPAMERMQAQKGTLKDRSLADTYAVTLIADFMKVYEVK